VGFDAVAHDEEAVDVAPDEHFAHHWCTDIGVTYHADAHIGVAHIGLAHFCVTHIGFTHIQLSDVGLAHHSCAHIGVAHIQLSDVDLAHHPCAHVHTRGFAVLQPERLPVWAVLHVLLRHDVH